MKKNLIALFICISTLTLAQNVQIKYADKYKDIAIKQMNEYGIPASIVLGVAIHESGGGASKVARHLNNHFGFKGHNTSKKINSSYKGYSSVEESYTDFINTLKRKKEFSLLFDKYSDHDYKNWALGIHRNGYATSKTWAKQVIGLIERYKLYQYDNHLESGTKSVALEIANVKNSIYYYVKKGDTLSAIAKRNNTTVKALIEKNSLKTIDLSLKQKLKI